MSQPVLVGCKMSAVTTGECVSKILIVEDEEDLAAQIKDWLAREHHTVEHVSNGSAAADQLVGH